MPDEHAPRALARPPGAAPPSPRGARRTRPRDRTRSAPARRAPAPRRRSRRARRRARSRVARGRGERRDLLRIEGAIRRRDPLRRKPNRSRRSPTFAANAAAPSGAAGFGRRSISASMPVRTSAASAARRASARALESSSVLGAALVLAGPREALRASGATRRRPRHDAGPARDAVDPRRGEAHAADRAPRAPAPRSAATTRSRWKSRAASSRRLEEPADRRAGSRAPAPPRPRAGGRGPRTLPGGARAAARSDGNAMTTDARRVVALERGGALDEEARLGALVGRLDQLGARRDLGRPDPIERRLFRCGPLDSLCSDRRPPACSGRCRRDSRSSESPSNTESPNPARCSGASTNHDVSSNASNSFSKIARSTTFVW